MKNLRNRPMALNAKTTVQGYKMHYIQWPKLSYKTCFLTFLSAMLANLRPTPLMAVMANMVFLLPSKFVFITRRMCWKLSGEISDILADFRSAL